MYILSNGIKIRTPADFQRQGEIHFFCVLVHNAKRLQHNAVLHYQFPIAFAVGNHYYPAHHTSIEAEKR
ncbi:MAG: hypothetical protein LBT46_14180, partial [Planctomycetaceae bacterium]|nr:hypothetical protein [Planctomycetaceae bacterium]